MYGLHYEHFMQIMQSLLEIIIKHTNNQHGLVSISWPQEVNQCIQPLNEVEAQYKEHSQKKRANLITKHRMIMYYRREEFIV